MANGTVTWVKFDGARRVMRQGHSRVRGGRN